MPQYDNNGKLASEAYELNEQMGTANPDAAPPLVAAPINPSSNADGEVQAREFAEDEKIKDIHRRICEIMDEDEAPQQATRQQQQNTGHVRRKNNSLTMDDLAGIGGGLHDAVQNVGMDLFHEGYAGSDNEAAQLAESMGGQSMAEPTWDWKAVKSAATLRDGKKVPVWMVENTSTGMQINKPFRIQGPAERIVSLLNVTGNANDPRVRQIQEDYDQYVSLTKDLRKCKQLYESGNKKAGQHGQQVAGKLREVKQRLGL
jgi:hypothetical protein